MTKNRIRVLRVLEKGLKKIEQGWCQKAFALDAQRRSVASRNPSAVCWCFSGALTAATRSKTLVGQAHNALTFDGQVSLIVFNDSLPERTGQRTVKACFRRTIKRLQKELDQVPD